MRTRMICGFVSLSMALSFAFGCTDDEDPKDELNNGGDAAVVDDTEQTGGDVADTDGAEDTGKDTGVDTGNDTGVDTGADDANLGSTYGSCVGENNCSDFLGSGWDIATMKNSCELNDDSYWVDGHCPAAGRIGLCKTGVGTDEESIFAYYGPIWNADTAKQNCEDISGIWL